MPKFEDILIQLFLAILYFVGVYIVGDVFWPDWAFQYALVGLILAMIGYLLLYVLGLHKPGSAIGLYISLGVAILMFGLIWLVVREVARGVDRWPLDQR